LRARTFGRGDETDGASSCSASALAALLLEAWMRGDATMPDAKLMDLARVLDKVGREDRPSSQTDSK
jgi:hypothetical protein